MKVSIFVLVVLTSVAGVDAQVLAVAPRLPLLVASSDGKVPTGGLAVELVQTAAARAGIKVSIEIQPWVRALDTSINNNDVLLFPVARTPDRESAFEWLGPVNRLEYKVFRLAKGTVPTVRSPADLKDRSVGVLRNDVADVYFTEKTTVKRLEKVAEYQNLTAMFLAGRFDYLAVVPSSFYSELLRQGQPLSAVESMFTLKGVPADPYSYLVVRKGSSPSLVSGLRTALDSMVQDGTWERIFRKNQEASTP